MRNVNSVIATDLIVKGFGYGMRTRDQARVIAKSVNEVTAKAVSLNKSSLTMKAKTPVKTDKGWLVTGFSFGKTLSIKR